MQAGASVSCLVWPIGTPEAMALSSPTTADWYFGASTDTPSHTAEVVASAAPKDWPACVDARVTPVAASAGVRTVASAATEMMFVVL